MRIAWMALTAWMVVVEVRAGEPRRQVTAYLRGTTIHPTVRSRATALASRMFAEIGVSLEWGKGEPSGENPRAVFIELIAETPESRMPGALAYALPYEGAHITVFLDRIGKGCDPDTVLAHVMVHEITHLLQGINRHSDTGVMKAHWTGKDFGAMGFAPLPFSPADVMLIYLGMAERRNGSGPEAVVAVGGR